MGAIILNIAFLVSGLLMLPPIVAIFGKGLQASPIDGAKELIGAQNFVQADLDSPMLAHVFWIDWGKNIMISLLCFAAVFVFDLSAKRATALIMIVNDLWVCAVQVITPIGGVKPWPALDGLFSNPMLLPIIGGQLFLLTIGLLTASGGKAASKPKAKGK